jgi:hypothetical protein
VDTGFAIARRQTGSELDRRFLRPNQTWGLNAFWQVFSVWSVGGLQSDGIIRRGTRVAEA